MRPISLPHSKPAPSGHCALSSASAQRARALQPALYTTFAPTVAGATIAYRLLNALGPHDGLRPVWLPPDVPQEATFVFAVRAKLTHQSIGQAQDFARLFPPASFPAPPWSGPSSLTPGATLLSSFSISGNPSLIRGPARRTQRHRLWRGDPDSHPCAMCGPGLGSRRAPLSGWRVALHPGPLSTCGFVLGA